MEPTTDLTDTQQRVFEALARVERDRGAVRPDEVADACELPLAEVREAVGVLVREDLVREVPATEDALGPRYRVKDNPA